jgi:surface polysaccharide O-acyltransferase-like enzyme
MLRSIGAVLAGLVAIFVLSIGTDNVLYAVGIFPAVEFSTPKYPRLSDLFYLFAMIYRTIYAVIGCYITARLAPNRPMKHALVLGLVGVVLSTVGAVATWNRGPAFGPHWYPLALIFISLPCAWIGGKLVRSAT